MPKKVFASSLDAELERIGKLHAEVEYYIDFLSNKNTVSRTASLIKDYYGEDVLDRIVQDRISKLSLVGGLVRELDYEEVRSFLRSSKLFHTFF